MEQYYNTTELPAVQRIARRSENWFRKHQRELPWRRTYDPYHVWVSEVMLQQTQMPVVLRFYERFIGRFPTIDDLASASFDDVAAAWSGLGYYRRARMLRDCAIAVRERFGGTLPSDLQSLMSLPGIGRYTAGAIASIAFERHAPIVDGNIARILARLFGVKSMRTTWDRAEKLVEAARSPRVFNQALMEIGALICRPKNPLCNQCPLRRECRAFARGRTQLAPRKRAKTREVKIALYIVTDRRGRILMRRESGSLFDGMFVLPQGIRRGRVVGCVRHRITNRRITFVVYRSANGQRRMANEEWIDPKNLENIPHPAYVRKALQIAGIR